MSEVPDALFPSSNEWGIPDLRLDRQADYIDLPVAVWGQFARTRKHRGTYHFYTDDCRFTGLWKDPQKLVASGCITAVEPNFSTSVDQPLAVTIWETYRKRWLARYWQENGVRMLVDMNVAPTAEAINMAGVPYGWRAYATRVHVGTRERTLDRQWKLAESYAGTDDFLFVVYGSANAVKVICEDRGWIFLKESHWPDADHSNEINFGKLTKPEPKKAKVDLLELIQTVSYKS